MLHKKLKFFRINLVLATIFIVSFAFSVSFASDTLSRTFDYSAATLLGSSASQIMFSTWGLSSDTTRSGSTTYYNAGNDTLTVWNYLSGYYYDTNYWFFDLQWDSVTLTNNVQVISTTSLCGVGNYGYKLWWYAKSIDTGGGNNLVGLIDFDYSSDIFVYYCDNDKKLHWYAYNEDIGFQSFEWIQFEVWSVPNIVDPYLPKSDPYFTNNNSILVTDITPKFNSIQGDIVIKDWGKESVFYIVK